MLACYAGDPSSSLGQCKLFVLHKTKIFFSNKTFASQTTLKATVYIVFTTHTHTRPFWDKCISRVKALVAWRNLWKIYIYVCHIFCWPWTFLFACLFAFTQFLTNSQLLVLAKFSLLLGVNEINSHQQHIYVLYRELKGLYTHTHEKFLRGFTK